MNGACKVYKPIADEVEPILEGDKMILNDEMNVYTKIYAWCLIKIWFSVHCDDWGHVVEAGYKDSELSEQCYEGRHEVRIRKQLSLY